MSNSYSIHHDFVIKASVENVYDAITNPKHLVNWWPLTCKGVAQVGEEYNFNFTDQYDWYGRVVKAEENKSFYIQMTKSDEDWNPTSFGFDLIETSEDTQVQFWHKGWKTCNAEFRQSSFCWAMLLNGLKNYIERDVIIPFEERE